jgi:methylmalonyl-CoA/ethylmalonyl-CoA epimerase
MIQQIDHIGIAVKSLEDGIRYYEETLGLHCEMTKFIEKNGEGIHHIAFKTDDISGQLKKASDSGARLIHEVPFEGAANKLVAFLHPKSTHGVLTEFCADKND